MKSYGNKFVELLDRTSLIKTVSKGSGVLVGVSGGADSVALLMGMCAIKPAIGITLTAVHINHGLRSEAAAEEFFVQSLCDRLCVDCRIVKLTGKEKPGKCSPEQFWRQSRYSEFEEILADTESDFLALGHTIDDLAETFLYHLTRGTGVDGLVFHFFKMAGALPIIRPLWQTSRSRIETALTGAGEQWTTDTSNQDVRYSRNLIRHNVISELKKINPSVVDAIARLSANLHDSISNLPDQDSPDDSLTENPRYFSALNDDKVLKLTGTASNGANISALIRNFVFAAATTIMDSRQTAQATRIIASRGTGLVALTGSKTLVLSQENGWIYPGNQPSDKMLAEYHTQLFGGLSAELVESPDTPVSSPLRIQALEGSEWVIEWSKPEPLLLRNRRAGDKINSKPLSKLLIEYKIPWYNRDFAVVLTRLDGEIVAVANVSDKMNEWIARHRKSDFSLKVTKSILTA